MKKRLSRGVISDRQSRSGSSGELAYKKLKMKLLPALVILANLLLAGFIIYAVVFVLGGKTQKNLPLKTGSVVSPTAIPPTPTPTLVPLLQGPQTYSIGQKDATPVMYELSLNTIDPKKGGTQKVDLKIKDDKADVVLAKAQIQTENSSFSSPLKLSSGTAKDGVWSETWQVNDVYDKKFMITFESTDQAGNRSSVDFTIR